MARPFFALLQASLYLFLMWCPFISTSTGETSMAVIIEPVGGSHLKFPYAVPTAARWQWFICSRPWRPFARPASTLNADGTQLTDSSWTNLKELIATLDFLIAAAAARPFRRQSLEPVLAAPRSARRGWDWPLLYTECENTCWTTNKCNYIALIENAARVTQSFVASHNNCRHPVPVWLQWPPW